MNISMSLRRIVSRRFHGCTVVAFWWRPSRWGFHGWGPWSEAKSYALHVGPLFVERYFTQAVEDGRGVPGPKLVLRRVTHGA